MVFLATADRRVFDRINVLQSVSNKAVQAGSRPRQRSLARYLAALTLLCLSGATIAQDDDVQVLDRIVALVNDGIVLQSELSAEQRTIVLELRRANRPVPTEDILQKQVLERLVVLQTQLQRARQLGIRVTDAQVNDSVRRIAENNGMTLGDFRRALLREGYDYVKFRLDIYRDLVLQQLRRREVERRISISEQEIDEHLAVNRQQTRKAVEHHLRHILLSVPEAASPETLTATRERVLAIRQRILDGENFATVATQESEGQFALEGGDLGWRTFAQMPARFAATVENLEVGDISEPIRSNIGFHLLLLEAVRGEQRHMIDQARARHILLRTHVLRDDKAAYENLQQLRNRALAGENFETLATSYSEDDRTASEGGDLGWIAPGRMSAEFERQLALLSPGEISHPFRTRQGWHVVELLERRRADNTESWLRNRAREQLRNLKLQEETELWLRRLRDEAYVEYL